MATIGKLFLTLLLIGVLAVPAMAGTEYLAGSPNLSAYISGTNEFSPNSETQITLIIKNTGINDDKYVQSGLVDRDDLPNTAKYLTASVSPGMAPLTIKTDPQMVGDLKGASSTSAVITAKINASAPGGTYLLPLTLEYSYLYRADQISLDTMQNTYKKEKITLNIPITIKSEVLVEVLSAEPEHLNAGTNGYLNLKLNNSGTEDGKQAIVKITRNGNSPIIPIDNSVYIGDFLSGKTISCRYKVSVSEGAEEQTYPVDVAVIYLNGEGDTVTSRTSTVGVPIGGKAEFGIISPPAEMHPGNKKSITVEYKNSGSMPVYSAQSRISAVDPFTSNNDIAYIGTLQPNESRVVTYEISVDRSATAKQYGLDSEIRYRDALDNTYISKPMKVNIDITAPAGISALLSNPIYLSILAAIIIGIAYFVFHYRRKKQ